MAAPVYHTLRPWVARRDYADASGGQSGAGGLCCSRCGARLRRGNYAALCAPCTQRLTPADRPTRSAEECPDCGGRKKAASKRCIYCANPHHGFHHEQ